MYYHSFIIEKKGGGLSELGVSHCYLGLEATVDFHILHENKSLVFGLRSCPKRTKLFQWHLTSTLSPQVVLVLFIY